MEQHIQQVERVNYIQTKCSRNMFNNSDKASPQL